MGSPHLAVQEAGQQLPALSARALQFTFAASHRFGAKLSFVTVAVLSVCGFCAGLKTVKHQVRVWQVADDASSWLDNALRR